MTSQLGSKIGGNKEGMQISASKQPWQSTCFTCMINIFFIDTKGST